MKKTTYYIIIIFLCLSCGFLLGNILSQRSKLKDNMSKFSSVLTQFGKNNKVTELISLIDLQYVDSIDTQKLTEDAIVRIMSDLDPHSVYIPAKDLADINSEMEGSFSGIGVQFNIQNDTIMIVGVISGGPSEKMGVLAGDRIVEVADSAFVGKNVTNEKVLKTLRGEKNSKVKLGILRRGTAEILHFTITRGEIPLKSIDIAYMIEPEIGFLRINRFSATTYNEFLTALADLRSKGAKKIMIDLRENSGGLLDQAVQMINEFLERGKMIVYSEGKAYPRFESKANGSGSFINYPLIILIDEFSASASEIFAGAIQDNDRGLVIGRRSYGKGLVQQQIPLSDGSAVRLTVSRYYTATGRSIQKPYELGKSKEYEQDIVNRFLHGEFYSQDSIQQADSLIYHTPKGRLVYGGGGVMPDIFVPRDTTSYSPYLSKVSNYGYIYQFAFQYVDKHRTSLNEIKSWQEMEAHLNKQDLLNQFVAFAQTKKLEPNWKEINISKKAIVRALNSNITRNILGEEGFFPLYYKYDPTVKRALEEAKTNELLRVSSKN